MYKKCKFSDTFYSKFFNVFQLYSAHAPLTVQSSQFWISSPIHFLPSSLLPTRQSFCLPSVPPFSFSALLSSSAAAIPHSRTVLPLINLFLSFSSPMHVVVPLLSLFSQSSMMMSSPQSMLTTIVLSWRKRSSESTQWRDRPLDGMPSHSWPVTAHFLWVIVVFASQLD